MVVFVVLSVVFCVACFYIGIRVERKRNILAMRIMSSENKKILDRVVALEEMLFPDE